MSLLNSYFHLTLLRMNEHILINGNYYFFTKIGMHAGETIHDILTKKSADIADYGYCLWSGRLPLVKRQDLLKALTQQEEVYVLCAGTDSTETTNDSDKDVVVFADGYEDVDGTLVTLKDGPTSTYTKNKMSNRSVNNKGFVITEIIKTEFSVNLGDFDYIYSDPKKPNGDASIALGSQNSNGVIKYNPSGARNGKNYQIVSVFKLKSPFVAKLI